MRVFPRSTHFAAWIAVACLTAVLPARAQQQRNPVAAAAASSAPVARPAAPEDSGDLPHRAALVLAAVAAVGFVRRRLRD